MSCVNIIRGCNKISILFGIVILFQIPHLFSKQQYTFLVGRLLGYVFKYCNTFLEYSIAQYCLLYENTVSVFYGFVYIFLETALKYYTVLNSITMYMFLMSHNSKAILDFSSLRLVFIGNYFAVVWFHVGPTKEYNSRVDLN